MVTRGQPDAQLSASGWGDRTDSQADSAGSIPVTRSLRRPRSEMVSPAWALLVGSPVGAAGPLTGY
jgi:hypothetical protein